MSVPGCTDECRHGDLDQDWHVWRPVHLPVGYGDLDDNQQWRRAVCISGKAISTTVLGGGTEYLGSGAGAGGTAIGATVSAGGVQVVGYSGGPGIASNTTVLDSGSEIISGGVAIGTIISNGGAETASAGGTTSNTTVSSGGTLTVLSGGLADPTRIFAGGGEVVSGTDTGDRYPAAHSGSTAVR